MLSIRREKRYHTKDRFALFWFVQNLIVRIQVYNTLIREKREGTELYLARSVVSFMNDTVYGRITRLRSLAELNRVLVTGSPSSEPSAGRKWRALVRSHCMNVRQSAGLLRVEEVRDINFALGKPVLTMTELVMELVEKNVFSREQVLETALNKFRLKDILDERLPAWDDSLSDKELSKLLDEKGAELNIAMVQDPVMEDMVKTQELEINELKAQVAGLREEKGKLWMEVQEMEHVKRENEQLRSELRDLKMAKGDILRSMRSDLIENALRGKVVVPCEKMEGTVKNLQKAVDDLTCLMRVSTLME